MIQKIKKFLRWLLKELEETAKNGVPENKGFR